MSQSHTIRISDYDGSLSRAQAALGSSGGTIVVNQPVTLLAAFIPNSNITIEGIAGIPITQTTPGENIFQLYAGQQNVKFSYLTLKGGRAAVSGFGCPSVAVSNCAITGSVFRGLDFGAGAPNLLIQGNNLSSFANGATDGIFCEDTGAGLQISSNTLNASISTHGIAVHTSGGSCISPVVSYNSIVYSGGNFAIEVGKFNSGNRILNSSISNNSIRLAGGGALGGISLSSADTPNVTFNSIDLGGIAPGIQAIEFADVNYGVATSNSILNNGANGGGIILDSTSNSIVTLNKVSGYISIVNSGTFAGNITITENLVQNNLLTIPAASTRTYIFFIQANVANCNGDNNKFIGNTAFTPVANPTTVHLENDGGGATINGTVDVGNAIGAA